jgi:C-terminal processing protease CtpA/Prc
LQDTVGYFAPPEGEWAAWTVKDHASYLDGERVVQVANPHEPNIGDGRVAVLIDRGVASSGEAVVVAFKGRPNTEFFGAPTCGIPTAIRPFPVRPGYTLMLAVAKMADRTGVEYDGRIFADHKASSLDEAVTQAVEYLRAPR